MRYLIGFMSQQWFPQCSAIDQLTCSRSGNLRLLDCVLKSDVESTLLRYLQKILKINLKPLFEGGVLRDFCSRNEGI